MQEREAGVSARDACALLSQPRYYLTARNIYMFISSLVGSVGNEARRGASYIHRTATLAYPLSETEKK